MAGADLAFMSSPNSTIETVVPTGELQSIPLTNANLTKRYRPVKQFGQKYESFLILSETKAYPADLVAMEKKHRITR